MPNTSLTDYAGEVSSSGFSFPASLHCTDADWTHNLIDAVPMRVPLLPPGDDPQAVSSGGGWTLVTNDCWNVHVVGGRIRGQMYVFPGTTALRLVFVTPDTIGYYPGLPPAYETAVTDAYSVAPTAVAEFVTFTAELSSAFLTTIRFKQNDGSTITNPSGSPVYPFSCIPEGDGTVLLYNVSLTFDYTLQDLRQFVSSGTCQTDPSISGSTYYSEPPFQVTDGGCTAGRLVPNFWHTSESIVVAGYFSASAPFQITPLGKMQRHETDGTPYPLAQEDVLVSWPSAKNSDVEGRIAYWTGDPTQPYYVIFLDPLSIGFTSVLTRTDCEGLYQLPQGHCIGEVFSASSRNVNTSCETEACADTINPSLPHPFTPGTHTLAPHQNPFGGPPLYTLTCFNVTTSNPYLTIDFNYRPRFVALFATGTTGSEVWHAKEGLAARLFFFCGTIRDTVCDALGRFPDTDLDPNLFWYAEFPDGTPDATEIAALPVVDVTTAPFSPCRVNLSAFVAPYTNLNQRLGIWPYCGDLDCFLFGIPEGLPPSPTGAALHGDVLAHRVGHWVANANTVVRAWHPDFSLTDTFTFDPAGDVSEARLAIEPHVERLSVVYTKGSGSDPTAYNVYRRYSHDWGATWKTDPDDGSPLLPNVRHAVEIVNYRNRERCDLYQDASEIDDDTLLPTGRGKIQCKVYDALGALVGTFPADGLGIGGILADDTTFSAYYEPEPGSYLACTFASFGERKVYRSYDDGRTWGEWTADVAPLSGADSGDLIMFAAAMG